MIRVDMMTLSYSTINKYAIGGEYGHIRYTNKIPFFYHIVHAVKPNQISNININVMRENNSAQKDKWNPLYQDIKELNGIQR
jgi:hypothetical protein